MGNRVRCPWHGACFNTKTGDIEEFPGLDSLPTYKVMSEGIDFVRYMPPSMLSIEHVCILLHFSKVKVENGKVHVTRNKKVSAILT